MRGRIESCYELLPDIATGVTHSISRSAKMNMAAPPENGLLAPETARAHHVRNCQIFFTATSFRGRVDESIDLPPRI